MWAVTVGWLLCPECGGAPAEERPPGGWERFSYWLVNRGKAPTTLVCANGHEWVRSSGLTLFRGSSSVPRWVRLPGRLFRTLLAERRAQPTPMTYLLAAGTGLLLGLVLDLALGWPWWAVTAGFVVFAWLLFLSSNSYLCDMRTSFDLVMSPSTCGPTGQRRNRNFEAPVLEGAGFCFGENQWCHFQEICPGEYRFESRHTISVTWAG